MTQSPGNAPELCYVFSLALTEFQFVLDDTAALCVVSLMWVRFVYCTSGQNTQSELAKQTAIKCRKIEYTGVFSHTLVLSEIYHDRVH